MQFNHYGGQAARLAADLVNASPDADLDLVLAAHDVHRPPLTGAARRALLRWAADGLAPCFTALAAHLAEAEREAGPAARCARVNALLAVASTQPRISLHDGHPHLHYGPDDRDAVAHVKASTAAGLAYVVCFAGAQRLGRCARAGCARAYVDTSRGGRRAYCSVRCANNDAVARHRARHPGTRP
ncbi:CGNR zinc finger domain-containing protein [Streptomyces sp. NPDC049954]|uniref:CGNR zinc finger domain-containing protein n=1 Tax=Streptomyces sp. NPDC049954 TaxID=3155779 RepID=UPI0034126562